MTTRRFIEGVLASTKASKVIVIGHSMGVTLAKTSIIGGTYSESLFSKFTVGDPITNSIAEFFVLAGANYGLVDCTYATGLPTCSTQNVVCIEFQNSQREFIPSGSQMMISLNTTSLLITKKHALSKSDASYQQSGYTHFDIRDKFGADILSLISKL